MAEVIGQEVLLVDINGGVNGVVAGLEAAMKEFGADLLVGLDVGGDSLAQGQEPGLRSPLADSIMLAAIAELEKPRPSNDLGRLRFRQRRRTDRR